MATALFIGYILYHLGLLKGWCLVLYIPYIIIKTITSIEITRN